MGGVTGHAITALSALADECCSALLHPSVAKMWPQPPPQLGVQNLSGTLQMGTCRSPLQPAWEAACQQQPG